MPATQRLGEEGQGFAYLMQELPRERLSISMMALGSILGAIEITKDYVLERKAFGQPLSQMQNTRFVLANAQIKAKAAQAFCRPMCSAVSTTPVKRHSSCRTEVLYYRCPM